MRNKIKIFIIIIIASALFLFCGKDKKPFLLFPTEENSQQQSSPINENQGGSGSNTQINDQEENSQQQSSPINENQGGSGSNTQINDQYGDLDNPFDTIINVNVNITVQDPDGPVQGAVISILDPSNNNANLFQQVTNSNGTVTGIVQIATNVPSVNLIVQAGDITLTFEVPVVQLGQYLVLIDRNIVLNDDVNNNNPPDSDGDGTPDPNDAYPDDPTRATTVIFPSSGTAIIAFEDSYPVPGDADANDVVIKVYNEEDHNTQGQVVRIRGRYKFLARASGFNHVVLIKLPGSGRLLQKVYDRNNNLVKQIDTHVDSFSKLPLFLKDATFFANPQYNSYSVYKTHELCSYSGTNNVYVPCFSSDFEIIFDSPQPKNRDTIAPYDFYIYVLNTGKEIHFPGLYFRNDGTDIYVDSDGFPWALLIPSEWNWPYEYRYITTGYPCFDNWYLSGGVNYADWYLRVDSTSQQNLFPYYNSLNYLDTNGCR